MSTHAEAVEELRDARPFAGWVERAVAWGDPWEDELEPTRAALEALLAEAGYPDADVYIDGTGVRCEGAPRDVVDKAEELVNAVAPRTVPT